MTAIAPMSVLMMGLLGMLVIAFGILRIVLAERRVQRPMAVAARPATPPSFSSAAA